MRVEFFWGKFAIAVLVEGFERLWCRFKFGRGEGPVAIGVERCDDGRQGWLGRSLAFPLLIPRPLGRRWQAQFVRGELAVGVLVQFRECFAGGFDLLRGQDAVVVRVDDGDDRRRWRGAPFAATLGFLGGCAEGGCQCEKAGDGLCFHDCR